MIDEQELIEKILQGDDEAFGQLFTKYYPIVRKIRRNYFIAGMDQDDWDQEARMVMHKTIQNYQSKQKVNFGSFYRMNLKNRTVDMIRKSNAQKRIPKQGIASIESNESYYSSMIADNQAIDPENAIMIGERLELLYNDCSTLEKAALLNTIYDLKFDYEEPIMSSAFERCRTKFKKDTN